MFARRFISGITAALSIGVCIFITYISRDTDQSTLMFNLAFLAVMLLMLAASYLIGIRRLILTDKGLRRATEAIRSKEWEKLSGSETQPLFQYAFLDECYAQYKHMDRLNQDSVCDIRNFINEEAVETHVHRGLLELIPDILTSLGILGTFVGLVMGLQQFDPSGYEQMAGSVTPLINGIKVAFITSIYGIALSLSFSFNLRSEFANLSALMDEFLETYYMHVRPPYEVDSLSKLLDQQRSQEDMVQDLTAAFVDQMGKSFEQAITPAFDRMTDGIDQIVHSFTVNQERVMSQVCDQMVRQMRSELSGEFEQMSRIITGLEQTNQSYHDFIDQSIEQMQQSFAALQKHMETSDQYTAQTLSNLSDAQEEAYRINQEQKATYQEYIRFMYQTIESFSDIWEKNSQKLQNYSDEIAKLGPVQSNLEIRRDLSHISESLADVQQRQRAAQATQSDPDHDTADMLRQTLRKLDDIEDLVDTPRLFRSRKRK